MSRKSRPDAIARLFGIDSAAQKGRMRVRGWDCRGRGCWVEDWGERQARPAPISRVRRAHDATSHCTQSLVNRLVSGQRGIQYTKGKKNMQCAPCRSIDLGRTNKGRVQWYGAVPTYALEEPETSSSRRTHQLQHSVRTKIIRHQVNIVSIFPFHRLTRNCRDQTLFLASPQGQNPRPDSLVRCFLRTKKRQDGTMRKELPTSYHQKRDATYASNKDCPKRAAVQVPLAAQTAMIEGK
jgi:hypothetical protein